MIKAIGYNLKHLADFNGRDDRKTFLLYLAFVAIVNVLISFAALIPTMAAAMQQGFDAARTGNDASVELAVTEHMIGIAGTLVWVGLGVAMLNIVLLAAAFVRRAHDSGLPGLVLVIPLGLQLVWMFFSYRQLDGIEETMRNVIAAQASGTAPVVQTGMIAQDLIGWLVVIIVLVIGSLKSQRSSNQYGDPSADA